MNRFYVLFNLLKSVIFKDFLITYLHRTTTNMLTTTTKNAAH